MTTSHEEQQKQQDRQYRIWFTGWGSGGHVYPISALLQHVLHDTDLHNKCKSLTRYGEADSLESSIASSYHDHVQFIPVQAGKIRRYYNIKAVLTTALDMLKMLYWTVLMSIHFLFDRIDVLFSKWWYVTIPVAVAARINRIPIVVHDSDTHLWLANKVVSKLATTKLQWFDSTFDNGFTVWQLLSRQLLEYDKSSAQNEVTHCLVIWWSQWASILCQLVYELADRYRDAIHFSVLTWTKNTERTTKLKHLPNVTPYPLVTQEDMATLLYQSDISISRWSATSLAEQQLFGISKCIIPLPYTWWDHQTKNALRYQDHHNDLYINQKQDTYDTLKGLVKQRLDTKTDYKKQPIKHADIEQQVEQWVSKTRACILQTIKHSNTKKGSS